MWKHVQYHVLVSHQPRVMPQFRVGRRTGYEDKQRKSSSFQMQLLLNVFIKVVVNDNSHKMYMLLAHVRSWCRAHFIFADLAVFLFYFPLYIIYTYITRYMLYTYIYIIYILLYIVYTGWNDKIVALEKTTWLQFRLMNNSFLSFFSFFFLLQTIY